MHAMQAKKIISVKGSSKDNMTFGQITSDSKDMYQQDLLNELFTYN